MKNIDIYTDGSYRDGVSGIGIVLKGMNYFTTVKARVYSRYSKQYRNMFAEIVAVLKALEMAKKLGAKNVNVFSDAEIIRGVHSGEYMPNSEIVFILKRKLYEFSKNMNIRINHVKGHNGNYYNELADNLSRKALEGDFYFEFYFSDSAKIPLKMEGCRC
jgi:ribonuclease HI